MALGLIPQKNEQRSIATVKRLIPIHHAKFAETAIAIITNHAQFVWVKVTPIINSYELTETDYLLQSIPNHETFFDAFSIAHYIRA